MLTPDPQSQTEETRLDLVPDALDEGIADEVSEGPRDVPRPIGPERLRELRERIQNGTYPTDAEVIGGLERLFQRD